MVTQEGHARATRRAMRAAARVDKAVGAGAGGTILAAVGTGLSGRTINTNDGTGASSG